MAHSRKKTPIVGITTARSEKADKREANRKERRKVHLALTDKPETELLPQRRAVSNVWVMAKDGKVYLHPAERSQRPKTLRK